MVAKTHGGELNDTTQLWRFMDFSKFVSMLEHGGLFFSRADLLDDPHEGARSREGDDLRAWKKLDPRIRTQKETMDRMMRWGRTRMFANCWHSNAAESAAMWGQYTNHRQTQEGVAIRTTVGILKELLDDECVVGEVAYIDYSTDRPEDSFLYGDYLRKRLNFQHEREIRALFSDHPIKRVQPGQFITLNLDSPGPPGVWKPMPLATLIQRIVVAPASPAWFLELVSQVVPRYGYPIPLVRSGARRSTQFQLEGVAVSWG
jgi:hypothetical protein